MDKMINMTEKIIDNLKKILIHQGKAAKQARMLIMVNLVLQGLMLVTVSQDLLFLFYLSFLVFIIVTAQLVNIVLTIK